MRPIRPLYSEMTYVKAAIRLAANVALQPQTSDESNNDEKATP